MKLLNLRYNPIVHSTPSYSLTIATSWNRLHQGTQMGLNINDSRCRYGCGCLWNRMEPETFFKCTVFITFTLDDEILVLASSDKKALEWFIHSCPNPNSSLLATMDEFVNESKNKRKHKSPSAGEGHDNLMCWCIIMLYGRSVLWSMVDGPCTVRLGILCLSTNSTIFCTWKSKLNLNFSVIPAED